METHTSGVRNEIKYGSGVRVKEKHRRVFSSTAGVSTHIHLRYHRCEVK